MRVYHVLKNKFDIDESPAYEFVIQLQIETYFERAKKYTQSNCAHSESMQKHETERDKAKKLAHTRVCNTFSNQHKLHLYWF